MPAKKSLKTTRTTVKRLPDRGRYDRGEVYALLDAGFICHIGFSVGGQPFVIPTSYWRHEDHIYFHGSAASRMLTTLTKPVPVCFTTTHVDGLVLARSGFNHSINYRSVVLLGKASPVRDTRAKIAAMRAFVDYVLPGRWSEIRPPNEKELRATLVLKLRIDEASAKVRTGGPHDDPADMSSKAWAGVIPFSTQVGRPIPAEDLAPGIALPRYVEDFRLRE